MKKIFSLFVAALMCTTMFADEKYYIAGTMTEWGTAKKEMALQDGKYQVKIALEADSLYEFKVVMNDGTKDNWYGNNGKATMTSTNCTGWWLNGGDNVGLQTTIAGEYTFTFVVENHVTSVIFPATPEPDPDPEEKVLPVVELVGEMNEWTPQALTPAEDSLTASIKVTLAVDSFDFKIKVAGNWLTLDAINDYYEIKRDHNAPEKHFGANGKDVRLIADVAGDYIFTWKYADSTIVVTFPANVGPEPEKLANGYYLISDPWSVESLSAEVLFAANPGLEGEFQLEVTLVENEEIKVVEVENEAIKTWFPDGMGNAYKVDAAHAGAKTVYFRPVANNDWKEFHEGGFFFIEANATAIDNAKANAKAVKSIENGMLIIRREGKTYNVLGVEIR